MATLYKINVMDAGYGGTWASSGESLLVEGRQMVRLPHGAILPADGYHDTIAAAKRAAADEIDAICLSLSKQAANLRQEAGGERMA